MSKTLVDDDLKQRGLDAQRKTLEGIFEFAECMVELNMKCEVKKGGSTYSKVAVEWGWVGSKVTASHWLKIGLDAKLCGSTTQLPSSMDTIYRLTTLTDEQFQDGLATGVINPDMRRGDVSLLKGEVPDKPVPLHEQSIGDQVNAGEALLDKMSLEGRRAFRDEVNKLVPKRGEVRKDNNVAKWVDTLTVDVQLEMLKSGMQKYHPDKETGDVDIFNSIKNVYNIMKGK